MAFKTLEPKETPLLWWVWKDKVGQPLEGYYVGTFDHESKDPKDPNHSQKVKVLVVYNKGSDVYYRAFLPKRYDFSTLKAGWKVRITSKMDKETQKLSWSVEYDDEDIEVVEIPDEYFDVSI